MAIAAMEIKKAAHCGVLGRGKEAWVVGRLCYTSSTSAAPLQVVIAPLQTEAATSQAMGGTL